MTTDKNIKLFYLSNLSTFVIPSKNGDSIWKTDLYSVCVCVCVCVCVLEGGGGEETKRQ